MKTTLTIIAAALAMSACGPVEPDEKDACPPGYVYVKYEWAAEGVCEVIGQDPMSEE